MFSKKEPHKNSLGKKADVFREPRLLIDFDKHAQQELDSKLREAVESGALHRVKELVLCGADINSKPAERDKDTNLIIAVKAVDMEIAVFLINNGAEVNERGEGGFTAVMHAVKLGSTEIVELLLENGADTHVKNDLGYDAIGLSESKSMKKLLLSKISKKRK